MLGYGPPRHPAPPSQPGVFEVVIGNGPPSRAVQAKYAELTGNGARINIRDHADPAYVDAVRSTEGPKAAGSGDHGSCLMIEQIDAAEYGYAGYEVEYDEVWNGEQLHVKYDYTRAKIERILEEHPDPAEACALIAAYCKKKRDNALAPLHRTQAWRRAGADAGASGTDP